MKKLVADLNRGVSRKLHHLRDSRFYSHISQGLSDSSDSDGPLPNSLLKQPPRRNNSSETSDLRKKQRTTSKPGVLKRKANNISDEDIASTSKVGGVLYTNSESF